MQGSLEAPPIIIKQDRGKVVLALVGVLALLIILHMFYAAGILQGSPLSQKAILAFFWMLAGFGFLEFLRPSSLIIDRDGMTWHATICIYRYEWCDLKSFYVYSGYIKQPAAIFSNSCRRHPIGRVWNFGTLGACWELDAAELVDLLNKARMHWAGVTVSK